MESPTEIYIQPNAQDRWFESPAQVPNCTKYIRADLAELTADDIRKIESMLKVARADYATFGEALGLHNFDERVYKNVATRFKSMKEAERCKQSMKEAIRLSEELLEKLEKDK